MAIRPDRAIAAAHDMDRPRTGANQTGAGSPTTSQQAVQEDISMTDAGTRVDAWVPRLGLVEVSAERAALVRGLFELAAWVADHPELPLPTVNASVYTGSGSWDAKCRVVDAVAAALGTAAAPTPRPAGTRYEVEATFGPIRLFSVAITDAEHAAYDVAGSYIGAVTSDPAPGAVAGGRSR